MKSLNDSLQDSKNWEQLKELAYKLFGHKRLREQSKTWICDCCGETHSESILILKD